jgi:nicotinamide-nucleotide amidase
VLTEAMSRAELVIVTGGLGPTSDDITREITAELLGLTLREDAATLLHIEKYLASRKRELNPDSRRQAQVPESATVLANDHGTAP